MITFFGLKLSYEAAVFFGLFVASELIGVSKYRSNSVVQLLLKVVEAVKPHRTEDDQINRVKDLFK
jgi:hypothetical protein